MIKKVKNLILLQTVIKLKLDVQGFTFKTFHIKAT